MKQLIITTFVLCAMYTLCLGRAAITYEISGGRFGDQTIHYCIARELSMRYGILFYYRPFKYSDKLMLSTTDPVYSESLFRNYKKMKIGHDFDSLPDVESNILYIVSRSHWKVSVKDRIWFGIPTDNNFLDLLKQLIKPIKPIFQKLIVPDDAITVAMHVRKGDGIDNPYNSQPYTQSMEYYIRVPYDDFYIAALKQLRFRFQEELLYIHIFTDAHDRDAILNKFKNLFDDPLMIFNIGSKPTGSVWDSNVLEDIFLMAEFDCLIRAHSSYSVVAQAIGNHKYVIFPNGQTYDGIIEYFREQL